MLNLDPFSSTFEFDNPRYDPICDQCGSGMLGFLVPDRPLGIKLNKICWVHDRKCDKAIANKSWKMEHQANNDFYDNITQQAINEGKSIKQAHIVADIYWYSVESIFAKLVFWKFVIFGNPKGYYE